VVEKSSDVDEDLGRFVKNFGCGMRRKSCVRARAFYVCRDTFRGTLEASRSEWRDQESTTSFIHFRILIHSNSAGHSIAATRCIHNS